MDSTACYFVQLVMCFMFCNITASTPHVAFHMRNTNNIQFWGVPKNHRRPTDWSGKYL